jgi:hypothetical protein
VIAGGWSSSGDEDAGVGILSDNGSGRFGGRRDGDHDVAIAKREYCYKKMKEKGRKGEKASNDGCARLIDDGMMGKRMGWNMTSAACCESGSSISQISN